MARFLTMILGIFSSTSITFAAGFVEIDSHTKVNTNDSDASTLVVYDVDETLVQPLDSYLVNEHDSVGKSFLAEFIAKHPEVVDWDFYRAVILRDAQRPLIENAVLAVVQEFKNRGAKVIALTSMNTGKMGFYESMESWRYNHLKSAGFSGDFADLVLSFGGFKRNPVFFKGILAADLENKGEVLGAFLKEVNFLPKHIIAIDDDTLALSQIREFCLNNNIGFKGYLYKGFWKVPWNANLIKAQAEYLLRHKVWINDTTASNLVSNCGSS